MGNHTEHPTHDDDGRCYVERDQQLQQPCNPDISPPMEIPVTLMGLCSFFTVI